MASIRKWLLAPVCKFLSNLIGCRDVEPDAAATEQDVRRFLTSYAADLRNRDREAIAELYDPRGSFRLGDGRKAFHSFDTIKDKYLNRWAGPTSFEWKDISIEVLSPTAAVVMACFEWGMPTGGEVRTYSYTGLLLKHSGVWKIRLEDESADPALISLPPG